ARDVVGRRLRLATRTDLRRGRDRAARRRHCARLDREQRELAPPAAAGAAATAWTVDRGACPAHAWRTRDQAPRSSSTIIIIIIMKGSHHRRLELYRVLKTIQIAVAR
ncbi:hypothetical protein SPRG_20083, partial [Saprolegnia parasitica CBS 223.65]